MLGVCRMLLRDPVEAEDAAQQTFLSAYRSLLGGTRPEHPAAWLATIARNECWARTQQRMRQPVSEQVTDELASPLPGPVEAATRRADVAALVTAIGALPTQQREALVMREFSGMSYADLAAALSVSEPAVESLLVRARRQLRLRLQPVYAASIAPVLAVREWIGRLGAGSEPALATAAKLGSLPIAAKLAAGVATLAVVGGVVVSGDGPLRGSGSRLPAEAMAVIGASDAAAGVTPGMSRTTITPRLSAPSAERSTETKVTSPRTFAPSVRAGRPGANSVAAGSASPTSSAGTQSKDGGAPAAPTSEQAAPEPSSDGPAAPPSGPGTAPAPEIPAPDPGDVAEEDAPGDETEADDGEAILDDNPADEDEADDEGPGGGDDEIADEAETEDDEASLDGDFTDDETVDRPSDDGPDEPEDD